MKLLILLFLLAGSLAHADASDPEDWKSRALVVNADGSTTPYNEAHKDDYVWPEIDASGCTRAPVYGVPGKEHETEIQCFGDSHE